MSLDVWLSGLLAGNKKGQGRIGPAPLDDGFISATGYRERDVRPVAARVSYFNGFADQHDRQSAESLPGRLRHLVGASVTPLFHF